MVPTNARNRSGVALVTGASRGLGAALTRGLVEAGWTVIVDARDAGALHRAADAIREGSPPGTVVAVPGDVGDPAHRQALVEAADRAGGLDLLVNNASSLGPSPLPALSALAPEDLEALLRTNAVAPLSLIQGMARLLHRSLHPRVVNVTSDAAVEAYGGWGGYGASKAALDQLSNVLATEEPGWKVWSVDPGDLRTQMHQDAFPGEDISDRPEPESVVPALLALIRSERPSGRVRLSDIQVGEAVGAGK